jgi:hypothetical protein
MMWLYFVFVQLVLVFVGRPSPRLRTLRVKGQENEAAAAQTAVSREFEARLEAMRATLVGLRKS